MKDKTKSHRRQTQGGKYMRGRELGLAFTRFAEYHPAGRLSRNLRRMLFDYLQTPDAGEALYFQDLMYDLEGLFDLLDALESCGPPAKN